MKKAVLFTILSALLISSASYALEFSSDLKWNKMIGAEHFTVQFKDTYSAGKRTGALIRLDLLTDKGAIKRTDIINTRRGVLWQLFKAEKIGVRFEYSGEPKITVASDWAKMPEVTYVRDEQCSGVPCKVYLWQSKDTKFFKIEYYYWISKDGLIVKQEDTKLGNVLQLMTDIKIYKDGTLPATLFEIPENFEIYKVN
jgi:hypothetical protein